MKNQDRELIAVSRLASRLYKALPKEKQDEVMNMAKELAVIEKYRDMYKRKKAEDSN